MVLAHGRGCCRGFALGASSVLGKSAKGKLAGAPGALATARWVESFVIAKSLCPWASRANRSHELRVVSSNASTEAAALADVQMAAEALLAREVPGPAGPRLSKRRSARLATTLVAFEDDARWASNFEVFDTFVRRAGDLFPDTSLVAFHPLFARWRLARLASGAPVVAHCMDTLVDEEEYAAAEATGSEVRCEFRRSEEPQKAVVVGTDETLYGVRSARLRFLSQSHDGSNGGEDEEEEHVETVPVEWIVRPDVAHCPLMADNQLHRSPVPVVHILRSDVLSEETDAAGVDAIFDLQWRNARLVRGTGK